MTLGGNKGTDFTPKLHSSLTQFLKCNSNVSVDRYNRRFVSVAIPWALCFMVNTRHYYFIQVCWVNSSTEEITANISGSCGWFIENAEKVEINPGGDVLGIQSMLFYFLQDNLPNNLLPPFGKETLNQESGWDRVVVNGCYLVISRNRNCI